MRERQGCRSASIEGDTGTWVIDVSVDYALGAWTAAVSTVLGDGRRTGSSPDVSARLLPVLVFCWAIKGSDYK